MFHLKSLPKFCALLLSLLVSLFHSTAGAVSIQDRHGDKLLLKLEGTAAEKGDRFLIMDSDGKKRALLEVTQIKEDDAVAHLIKGTMTQDISAYTVQSVKEMRAAKVDVPAAEDGGNSSNTPALPTSMTPKKPQSKPLINIRGRAGFLAGTSQNMMKVNLTGASSLNLKGNGFSAEGFYEGSFNSNFQMLLRGGVQTLKAGGTLASAACGGSPDCSLDITYASLEGLGKYMFSKKDYAPWIGGGVGLLIALSKSSNVVDTEKIGFTQKIIIASGLQIPLHGTSFIPLQIDYTLFPNSTSVSISQIFLRIGYGFKF